MTILFNYYQDYLIITKIYPELAIFNISMIIKIDVITVNNNDKIILTYL